MILSPKFAILLAAVPSVFSVAVSNNETGLSTHIGIPKPKELSLPTHVLERRAFGVSKSGNTITVDTAGGLVFKVDSTNCGMYSIGRAENDPLLTHMIFRHHFYGIQWQRSPGSGNIKRSEGR